MRLAKIADALPGLLSWRELWGLDFREEVLLSDMASSVLLHRKLMLAEAFRLGQSESKDYRKYTAPMLTELNRLETGKTQQEQWAQNWEDVRAQLGKVEVEEG